MNETNYINNIILYRFFDRFIRSTLDHDIDVSFSNFWRFVISFGKSLYFITCRSDDLRIFWICISHSSLYIYGRSVRVK